MYGIFSCSTSYLALGHDNISNSSLLFVQTLKDKKFHIL